MKLFSAILITVVLLTVPVFSQNKDSNDKFPGFAGAGVLFDSESNPNVGFVGMGQVNLVDGFGIFADYTYDSFHTSYLVLVKDNPAPLADDYETRYHKNPSHSLHVGPAFRLYGNDSLSVWATVGIGARIGKYDKVLAAEFGGYIQKKLYKKVNFLFAPLAVTDNKVTAIDLRCIINYTF
jgi:hypothetical protein